MISKEANEMIIKVRLGHNNTNDFKQLVISELEKVFKLTNYQATECYQAAEQYGAAMESIYYQSEKFAQFAQKILNSIKYNY